MAEDQPSLHIDTDWKRQAQEEKRRLAEQEQQRQQKQKEREAASAVAAEAAGAATGTPAAAPAGRGGVRGRGQREMPPASFGTIVQSIVTQALLYMGELAVPGGEPMLNLDMAKHHIDSLGVLEEKTANNLTEDERRLLDNALYETRTRFVSIASQFI